MDIKLCPRCKERPISGLNGYCAECRREYQREYYHKRKETLRQQHEAVQSQEFLQMNDVPLPPEPCSECGRLPADLETALVYAYHKVLGFKLAD